MRRPARRRGRTRASRAGGASCREGEAMGDLASSPPPPPTEEVLLPLVFVDGDQTVDLGTVTVHPSLPVRKLQAVVADRVGLAPQQISASLARPRRSRRVPLDDATDLAAAVAREGAGCYVLAALRRSRRDRRGGRSRREKKAAGAAAAAPPPERTILRRFPAAAPAPPPPPPMYGAWDYEAQLRELQRQRDWYLVRTAAADPYAPLTPGREDPPLWSPRRQGTPSPCPECEAAAALGMREAGFHWCVRDPVTVAFRSPVGPIERPPKKSPSPTPSPPPATPGRMPPALVGMMPAVY